MHNDNQGVERHQCDVLVIGGGPIGRSMFAVKTLYFLANITQPRRAFAAWHKRRANIRPADEATLASTS
ncbi:hypothetical protein [Hydrogenophaga palleronii]|uniref:hypothetical protein n=1 Tax=Hydrogenophaga palleronii TaxID=65655 RepID=UPI0008251ADA|nr:hypothetical protein [Hydrogenophaga palleronii]